MIAMANVAYPHLDQVAGSKFAVEPQVEHGELTNAVLKLKSDSDRPNLFQFEWRCLTDDHALVPRCVLNVLR